MFSPSIESLVNNTKADTYSLLRLLRKELPEHIPTELPLISLGFSEEHGGRMTVYKNMQFDTRVVKRSIKLDEQLFKPALAILDKKPEQVSQSSYLRTQQRLKFTSFLIKYLKLRDTTLRDDEIRDMANKLIHILYKDSLKTVICSTLKDHSELYTKVHAQSCMSPGASGYNNWLKSCLHRNYGLWPSMWYYYNPHTKGVWLEVSGRKVARTILLRRNTKGKFNKFYSVYAESRIYEDLFVEQLSRAGLDYNDDCEAPIIIQKVFKIPAIRIFEEPICPLPFHDCIDDNYYVYFNKEENVFYFGPKRDLPSSAEPIYDPYDYNGYIDSQIRPAHNYLTRR